MLAAIAALRKKEPARIVAAVPVCPPDTLREVERVADETLALFAPDWFRGVGQFYEELRADQRRRGAPSPRARRKRAVGTHDLRIPVRSLTGRSLTKALACGPQHSGPRISRQSGTASKAPTTVATR